MRKAFLTVALIALATTTSAFAQKPPTDQQVEAARATMLQGEAQFFQLAATRLQAQLAEATAAKAAVEHYWAEYVKGLAPAPPAPAASADPPASPVTSKTPK